MLNWGLIDDQLSNHQYLSFNNDSYITMDKLVCQPHTWQWKRWETKECERLINWKNASTYIYKCNAHYKYYLRGRHINPKHVETWAWNNKHICMLIKKINHMQQFDKTTSPYFWVRTCMHLFKQRCAEDHLELNNCLPARQRTARFQCWLLLDHVPIKQEKSFLWNEVEHITSTDWDEITCLQQHKSVPHRHPLNDVCCTDWNHLKLVPKWQNSNLTLPFGSGLLCLGKGGIPRTWPWHWYFRLDLVAGAGVHDVQS